MNKLKDDDDLALWASCFVAIFSVEEGGLVRLG